MAAFRSRAAAKARACRRGAAGGGRKAEGGRLTVEPTFYLPHIDIEVMPPPPCRTLIPFHRAAGADDLCSGLDYSSLAYVCHAKHACGPFSVVPALAIDMGPRIVGGVLV